MKYRKKPAQIEAIQFMGNNFIEIYNFTNGKAKQIAIEARPYGRAYCVIEARKGPIVAIKSNYIVKDTNGDFYIYDWEKFEQIYEPIDIEKEVTEA